MCGRVDRLCLFCWSQEALNVHSQSMSTTTTSERYHNLCVIHAEWSCLQTHTHSHVIFHCHTRWACISFYFRNDDGKRKAGAEFNYCYFYCYGVRRKREYFKHLCDNLWPFILFHGWKLIKNRIIVFSDPLNNYSRSW